MSNNRTLDSLTLREDTLRRLGYDEMCANFTKAKLINDVYHSLNSDQEFHYSNSFDEGYYSSIYIPNSKTMNDTLEPIFCISYNLSSSYGENSICGFYIENRDDTTIVLLDSREAAESLRPVLIYDIALVDGYIIPEDTSVFGSDSVSTDSIYMGGKIESTTYHFWFSRINISSRHESDNTSEVRGFYYSFDNGYYESPFPCVYIKDICSSGTNITYSIWIGANNWVYTVNGYEATTNFISDHTNTMFGVTFEYDWNACRKDVTVTNASVAPYSALCRPRMGGSHDYYQRIATNLNSIPEGWYQSIIENGLTWIHHWSS